MNTSAQLQLVEMLHPVLNDEIRRIFDDSLAILARKLDLPVSYVYTFDFVHKNIRPESVLLFPRETHAGSGGVEFNAVNQEHSN